MNELIIVNNGVATLDKSTDEKIAELERMIKEFTEFENELRAKILEEMEQKNIKKVETDALSIIYKATYDKESFDSKKFRADHADLYDEYVKIAPVKASVQIKVK